MAMLKGAFLEPLVADASESRNRLSDFYFNLFSCKNLPYIRFWTTTFVSWYKTAA
jgi:hypothetical protein